MRPTIRLLLIFIIGCLLPWFVPDVRDILRSWSERAGVEVILDRARYAAAPASIAIIRAAKARYAEFTSEGELTVKADGVVVERGAVDTPATEDISLDTGCTLSPDEVEAVLEQYSSPAAGKGLGGHSVRECQRTGIDNGVWLAMFIKESGAGAAPQWAGNKGNGSYTANTGNIVCAGYSSCYGRFRDYDGEWWLGTTQHFELLRCYRDGGGEGCEGLWTGKSHATIVEAINTWAPPIENDTNSYANYVVSQVREWRQAKANVAQEALEPIEVSTAPAVNCQAELWPGAYESLNWSYGWHAGAYDWPGAQGTPVHAPVCGTFVSQGAYWDDMKYGAYVILLTGGGLEVYLGHLEHDTVNPLAFQPGQRVEAGQQVGELSDFAYSSPHTHVQLRRNGALVGPEVWWQEWENR